MAKIIIVSELDAAAELLTNKINEAAEAARADRKDFSPWTQAQDDDDNNVLCFRS